MKVLSAVLLFILLASTSYSQSNDSRTFLNSYFDINDESNNYIESYISYYERPNMAYSNFQGNYNFSSRISLAVNLKFHGDVFNFDESNTILVGKYSLMNDDHKISIGPYYELTEGSLGVWASYFREFSNNLEIFVKSALIYESKIFGEYYNILGAGLLYQISENIDLIGEGSYSSSRIRYGDFIVLSGGIKYNLFDNLNFRGSIGHDILDNSRIGLLLNGGLEFSF
ncbi:MAG: hypothetical protein HND52_09535 [Ignavibacteriae bacterium]|nr:hypothetical protein [Ignavibacteriota bacterium]NOG98191.1 hypothetical protein [Ignavibacteriota bacterium]